MQSAAWESSIQAGNKAYLDGQYAEAERQFQLALSESDRFEPDDPRILVTLKNLANLYRVQSWFAEAEPLYKRCLQFMEKNMGKDHYNLSAELTNLASLYRAQGMYNE